MKGYASSAGEINGCGERGPASGAEWFLEIPIQTTNSNVIAILV